MWRNNNSWCDRFAHFSKTAEKQEKMRHRFEDSCNMNILNWKLYQKINSIRTWSSRKVKFLSEITSFLPHFISISKSFMYLFFVVQVVLVLTLQITLSEKIWCKKRRLHQLTSEYDRVKQKLQYQLSPIDFMHVLWLFLVERDTQEWQNKWYKTAEVDSYHSCSKHYWKCFTWFSRK